MRSKKTILIFGGHGATALALTPLLIANNHTVYSIIRNPSQIPSLEALGAHPILQDLSLASTKTLIKIMKSINAEVCIWAAGAAFGHDDQAEIIDHLAAVRSFDAAATALPSGAKRYISISAWDVRDRSLKKTPWWYDEHDKAADRGLWSGPSAIMNAKLKADRELVSGNKERGLEWNIVRPVRLLNDEGTGMIGAGRIHVGKGITREDLARVLSYCVDDEDIAGLAFDVGGGEESVDEALEVVAEQRIDCFKGYY